MTELRMVNGWTPGEWLDFLNIASADDPKLAALAATSWGGNALKVLQVNATENGWQFAALAGYTDEQAQDAVGAILTDSATIDFTYDDGAGTISATATAVAFPATMVPSADPNTLDDYEEGTFTPALLFGGANTGMTTSAADGRYTKIGRVVFIELRLVLTVKGSSTGAATVSGLPFTTAASPLPVLFIQVNNVSSFNVPIIGAANGVTVLGISNFNGSTRTNATDANFANNSIISVSGFYTAA